MDSTHKTETLSKLRDKYQMEASGSEEKFQNRFGLFSVPPAGVIGSGDYQPQKSKMIGDDGKVKTERRGIFTNPKPTGKLGFTGLIKSKEPGAGFITIGDKYIDPASIERKYELEQRRKFPHADKFKPSSPEKSDPVNVLFPYMNQNNDKKKTFRGPDGKVKTSPPNISASVNIIHSPGKKNVIFGHLFSPPAEYIPTASKTAHVKHDESVKKEPFKLGSPGGKPFFDDKKTYNSESLKALKHTSPPIVNHKKYHDAPFFPASPGKKGTQGLLGPLPEYKSDPIRVAVRKDVLAKKDPFKPNNTGGNIRPTPSISLFKMNLKHEMNRISSTLF